MEYALTFSFCARTYSHSQYYLRAPAFPGYISFDSTPYAAPVDFFGVVIDDRFGDQARRTTCLPAHLATYQPAYLKKISNSTSAAYYS
jgi:hypothetical protein